MMKSKLLLFIMFIYSLCIARDIKHIAIIGDSLDSGKDYNIMDWYYIPGDDSLKGRSLEIDSANAFIASLDIVDSTQNIEWNGRGWFKRIIEIDSSLYDTPVAFTLSHYGASQVYLNGEKINTYGELNLLDEELFHPRDIPFITKFPSTKFVTIAVRYSNYRSVTDSAWFNTWIAYKGFSLSIEQTKKKIINLAFEKTISAAVIVGLFGLFFSLGVLYLVLFAFYSRNLENLFFSLFTLSLGFAIFVDFFKVIMFKNLELLVLTSMLPNILLVAVFLFYILFLYRVFYEKTLVIAWIFSTIATIIVLLTTLAPPGDYLGYLLFGFIIIIAFEGIRIIIVAFKKKKENVWIIGSGVILFAGFIFLLFAINLFSFRPNQYVSLIMLFTGVFSLPVSMAVYLARKVADTNKDLEVKIEAIKEFSERELENQKHTAELQLQKEKEAAKTKEAELRAEAAELQAKATEAQSKVIQAENVRKSQELEEARQLQMSMLPTELPKLENCDIAVYMQTATEVGGDYYDFHVDKDNNLTIALGDATGHGLNAGTLVTATKSLFKSLAGENDILSSFNEITRVLKEFQFRFLSMCLAILKLNNRTLTFSSAGIPPILIYRAESKSVEEYLLRGLPLGVRADFPYEVKSVELNPGDTIFIMSDGYPELFNEQREMLGYDRVKKNFAECANLSAEGIIKYLKQSVIEWSNNLTPDDDVTFVILKIK